MYKNKRMSVGLAILAAIISAQTIGNETSQQQKPVDQKKPDDVMIEEVIVTAGYRKSLQAAMDLKRDKIGFSDAIVATDIAAFPDQNLAEALQRIPGVAIERKNGLGTTVNVRSLGTQFTHATINNIATSSGSGGREVNFDIFASELIQSVSVNKSPTAADEEGGVAGVVSIQTARPFDYDGFKLAASGEMAHNSLSEEKDPRYAFLISNTFSDDKLGLLFSYAAEDRTNRTDRYDTNGFSQLSRITNDNGGTIPEGITGDTLYNRNVRDHLTFNEQEKWGMTAAIQFRLSDDLLLGVDLMAGRFTQDTDDYLYGTYVGRATRAYDLTIDDNNIVTKGSFDNAQHEFKSYTRLRDEKYEQFGVNLDWQLGEWNIRGLLGRSNTEKDGRETQLKWTYFAALTQEYTSTGVKRSSSDFEMTADLDGFGFDKYDRDEWRVKDDKSVLQVDISRDLEIEFLPELSTIRFGTRYSEKSTEYSYGYTTVRGTTLTIDDTGDVQTSQEYRGESLNEVGLVSLRSLIPGGGFADGVSSKFSNWMVVPNDEGLSRYHIEGMPIEFRPGNFYKVEEDILGAYFMVDFDFEIAGLPTEINTGARYVLTEQTSYGYQRIDGDWSKHRVKFNADYDDVLPSFNMRVNLQDDLLLRFAVAKVMTRPQLSQLSGRLDVSTNNRIINAGNPDLEPLRAKQADLSVEWYYAEESLVSLTAFYKDLESFVTEAQSGTMDYNGEPFDFFTYVNAKGATIKGAEFIFQTPFTFLPEGLDGFGVNFNYTYVDSTAGTVSDLGIKLPLIGLSRNSFNFTLYYEKYGADVRLAYNYKDKSIKEMNQNIYPLYQDDYGQLDLSAGYQFSDNVKVTLKAINVTDEKATSYFINENYQNGAEIYGRRVSLGLRMTF